MPSAASTRPLRCAGRSTIGPSSGRRPLAVIAPTADDEPPTPSATEGERLVQGARMAAARGDREAERSGYLKAAAAYSRADRIDAALDACQRALSISPGDTAVHLALARLYFERGWRDRGVEKLVLLGRLVDVEPLDEARLQIVSLARERAADDPRLAHLLSTAEAAGSSQVSAP